MNMTELHTKHLIEPLASLVLRDAHGSTVTCVSGRLWLTMEGDTRDVILEPGTAFTVDRDGVTILAAEQESVVDVRAPVPASGWLSRIVRFLDRNFGPAAVRPVRNPVY